MGEPALVCDKHGLGYLRLTRNEVAYSVEIEEDIVADFDRLGALVGVEFVDGEKYKDRAANHVEKARTFSRGPAVRPN